jgi:hypothetical protein
MLQYLGILKRNTSFEYDITSLCARQAGNGPENLPMMAQSYGVTPRMWWKITAHDIYHVMGHHPWRWWASHVFKLTHPHDGPSSIKAVAMFKRE